MKDFVANELENIHTFISESQKGSNTKDKEKDMTNVKDLLKVKDIVDEVFSQNDATVLRLDALDEALKMLKEHEAAKSS